MYWSIALLVASVSFLVYRHPSQTLQTLPPWLRPGKRRNSGDGQGVRSSCKDIKAPLMGDREKIPIEPEDEQSTPKARPQQNGVAVPALSLQEDKDHTTQDDAESSAASFPAINSAQRTSSKEGSVKAATLGPGSSSNGVIKPPLEARASRTSASSLMPPPTLPTPAPNRAPAASSQGGLRVPSTGPLPNRGPPANSQQRASASLSPSSNGRLTTNGTAVSTPNPRNKILLSPGHSPMDWAALTRSPGASSTLTGVSSFQRVTPSRLRSMTGRKGKPAWSSWQGKVYNITPYLPFHPGGEPELMKAAGRDGAKLFMEVHPWVNWENMLGSCLVGVLVPEEESSLEEMD